MEKIKTLFTTKAKLLNLPSLKMEALNLPSLKMEAMLGFTLAVVKEVLTGAGPVAQVLSLIK